MTSKEIIERLRKIKKNYWEINELYVFWSTANFSRKENSDIDIIIINGLDKQWNHVLVKKVKQNIRDLFWLKSDIITWKSINQLKSISLNQNIFKNLIKI